MSVQWTYHQPVHNYPRYENLCEEDKSDIDKEADSHKEIPSSWTLNFDTCKDDTNKSQWLNGEKQEREWEEFSKLQYNIAAFSTIFILWEHYRLHNWHFGLY